MFPVGIGDFDTHCLHVHQQVSFIGWSIDLKLLNKLIDWSITFQNTRSQTSHIRSEQKSDKTEEINSFFEHFHTINLSILRYAFTFLCINLFHKVKVNKSINQ